MPIVFHPAHLSIFTDDLVLHIIQIVLAFLDLFGNTSFHFFQFIGMHDPPKRVACQFSELFPRIAAENTYDSFIGIHDLFVFVGMIDKKTAGHCICKIPEQKCHSLSAQFLKRLLLQIYVPLTFTVDIGIL